VVLLPASIPEVPVHRFSLTAGLLCAVVDTASMIPLAFPTQRDKRVAMTSAFERFVLGPTIGPVTRALGGRGVIVGPVYALAASTPTALITRSYAPVLGMGVLNGLAVGAAYDRVRPIRRQGSGGMAAS
jgi:hypothetical protein